MSMSYAQMVTGCRRRNSDAWRALYDEFAPMAMGVCCRFSSCEDEARDLLQDAFVKILENIGTLREPEKLRSWIYNIVVNTCIQNYRRNHRLTLKDDIDTIGADQGELLYSMDDIVDALQQLPPAQRMAINLCYIEELGQDEAARRMGCEYVTLRGILSKARARMRLYLETKMKKRYNNGLEELSS